MTARNIHVVPANDGWSVEAEGASQSAERFDTQEAAIAAGTKRAKQDKVELIVHGRDGQIRERNSFGNDPRDIRG